MGKDSKSTCVDIRGWNMFFLFQLGLCAIIFVMSFISDFASLRYSYELWYRMISIIFIAVYAILLIRAFVKRRAFVVQLAMVYFFALFLYTNCELLGIILYEELLGIIHNTDMFLCCIIGMIWFAAWIMYLLFSKQMEKLFPTSERVSRKKDYLAIVFIVGPEILFWIY